MDKMQTQELISALADGQLQGEAFDRGVELAAGDGGAREIWHTYHLIGDVLRSGEHVNGSVPAAFLGRLQLRLRQEPPLCGGGQGTGRADAVFLPVPQTAANDPSFRWKVAAGVSTVAAVAALGWAAVGGIVAKPELAQLAVAPPAAVVTASERGLMIRDAHLDEFLAAHRQLGGASALQMPAGFLRNVTFEGPVR